MTEGLENTGNGSDRIKPPPLCFVQQNIGEVARSDGGVKKQKNDSVKRFLHSSPTVSRSITGCRKAI